MLDTAALTTTRNPYPRLFYCHNCGSCLGFYTTKSSTFFSCSPKSKREKNCHGCYISLEKAAASLERQLVTVLAKCAAQTLCKGDTFLHLQKVGTLQGKIARLEEEFWHLLEQTPLPESQVRSLLEQYSFYQSLLEAEENQLIESYLQDYYARRFMQMAEPFLETITCISADLLSTLVEKIFVTASGQLRIQYKYIGYLDS